MRYIKLISLFIFVYLTKLFFVTSSPISLDTHSKMHKDFQLILGDAILLAVPAAKNIKHTNLSSKFINEDHLQIIFSSQFLNDNNNEVKIILEGVADLKRMYSEQLPTNKWSIESFTLGDEQIEFQEEIVIEVDRSNLQ